MVLTDVLERLSDACGVAGREEEIRALMRSFLKPYVDEIREDRLGNVIGIRKGRKNAPKVMLAAHMDEIGLLVKNIGKDGFLNFAKIGGIDDRILLAQKIIVYTEKGPLHGVIGSKPTYIQKEDERKKVFTYDELFIDVGAERREHAGEMGVRIGDPVGFDIKFAEVGNNAAIGKAFDDRVGCAVMIEALKRLKKATCTIYAVGTVQEEVGLRGAQTAAFGIDPDIGIALDVTVAGDVPRVLEMETPIRLRKGPAIEIADSGLIAHPKIVRSLVDAAKKNKIPYQLETGLAGSTDAARIALTRGGVPSGVISVPTRYVHCPSSLVSLDDTENAVKLTIAFLQEISNS